MENSRSIERTQDVKTLMQILGIGVAELASRLNISENDLADMFDSGLTLDEFVSVIRALGELKGAF